MYNPEHYSPQILSIYKDVWIKKIEDAYYGYHCSSSHLNVKEEEFAPKRVQIRKLSRKLLLKVKSNLKLQLSNLRSPTSNGKLFLIKLKLEPNVFTKLLSRKLSLLNGFQLPLIQKMLSRSSMMLPKLTHIQKSYLLLFSFTETGGGRMNPFWTSLAALHPRSSQKLFPRSQILHGKLPHKLMSRKPQQTCRQ